MLIFRKTFYYSRLIAWAFIDFLPDDIRFNKLRTAFLRKIFKVDIGRGSYIKPGFYFKGNIKLGSNCKINRNVGINASAPWKITVGDNVLLASNVVIRNANHVFADPDTLIRLQGMTGDDITIESDVWIGSNAVILPGVTIGEGSVVGAGAVVTKSVDKFSVVAGVPAKLINQRENHGFG